MQGSRAGKKAFCSNASTPMRRCIINGFGYIINETKTEILCLCDMVTEDVYRKAKNNHRLTVHLLKADHEKCEGQFLATKRHPLRVQN